MQLTNYEEKDLNSISLEMPGNYINILGVAQRTQSSTQVCSNYDNQCVEYSPEMTCTQYDNNNICIAQTKRCVRYENKCVSYVQSYGSYDYKKLDYAEDKLSKSYLYKIYLEDPISNGETSNIVLVYKAKGYADNILGAWNFEFESAKMDYLTNSIRVAVNTQTDFKLKGTSSNVNYQNMDFALGSMQKASSGMVLEDSNMVQSSFENVKYMSGYVKTNTMLDPNESFSVRGEYSKSWLRLYWWNILIWLVVVVAVIALFVFIFRKVRTKILETDKKNTNYTAESIMTGLGAAVGIILYWALIIALMNFISNSRGMDYDIRTLLSVIIVIFSILLTLAVLIGTPLLVGQKFDMKQGFIALISMLVTGFIISIIILIILGLTNVNIF